MRGQLTVVALCAALVLGLPVHANEKPTPQFQAAMKELGSVNNALRNNLKTLDYPAIEKDATRMKAAFTTVLQFWQEKKVDDAIALSQAGIDGASELELAAKAEDHPRVVTAQAALSGSSSSGEIGAIGVCAPCHTAHRVRLTDGTYEIK